MKSEPRASASGSRRSLTVAARTERLRKMKIENWPIARERAAPKSQEPGAKSFQPVAALVLALSCVAAGAETPAATAKLDRAGILRELTDFSLAGMHKRLGPDYAFYHPRTAAVPAAQAGETPALQGKEEKFPEIYMPPVKEGAKGRRYEIGGPWTKQAGDFSSTQGQILYVPDAGFGVDRVTIIEWSNGCFSERPEPPWWGGFRPEPESKKWLRASGGHPGAPVFMARGMANWANNGIIVFSSGMLGIAGTCTAKGGEVTFQFPQNKIPTAISVTNKNEFALVTVIDTEQMKGQVAVLALESSAKKTGFAHEWHEDHPALCNVAMFTGFKLLGYVDLPGILAPTGICAVGNATTSRLNGPDGNQDMLSHFDLSKQNIRDKFYKGDNAAFACSAGFAVVICKYEEKVIFLDLQPLFERVREMYFTSEANYQKTLDIGPGPMQWPPTFEGDPGWKPPVVAFLDQPQPTAVIASMSGGKKARAFVASLDGRVCVYQVGGLATEEPALAADIKCLETVQVGRNPVWLAYQKYAHDTIIAVSRGDRELAWIKYSEKGAQVTKRLRDVRLLDPVHVECSDTHGIETALLTVADFRGRKIINYRFSQLVFATQGGAKFGMGPDGKDEFECGGLLEFPGCPFCISATNVN